MAHKKATGTGNTSQFSTTQRNLDKKGKTNKKLKSNRQASTYLSTKGQELKDSASSYAKEHFKKGHRTLRKKELAEVEQRKP